MRVMLNSFALDFSQPPIFSYFYWIVERADRIARELDAGAEDILLARITRKPQPQTVRASRSRRSLLSRA